MDALRKAAEQALEALGYENSWHEHHKLKPFVSTLDAITALRAALAEQEQEQEPVAWRLKQKNGYWNTIDVKDLAAQPMWVRRLWKHAEPLYTHPPRREWEPVTWGVDWGRYGDQSCCTIIKRHADGSHEVVAVEYSPPRREWAEQEQAEPVAWMVTDKDGRHFIFRINKPEISEGETLAPLYTRPSRREWQGLTDAELDVIYAQPQTHKGQYARAIEAALKERNHG